MHPANDALYDMLFCDRPERFAPAAGRPAAPWQTVLFNPGTDPRDVLALSTDEQVDARVRALAWNWLRERHYAVPKRQLLGVIFEVPMERGMDTLAAYLDGSVRLLHHAGPPAIFEGPMAALQPTVERVFMTAQHIVDRIGPSDKPRQPVPAQMTRLSFIVSDGLYYGQGPMQVLQSDAMAGPLLSAGAELLTKVVELAMQQRRAA